MHFIFLMVFFFFLIFIFTLFYFTILYWFCHTLTWIHHGCTCILAPLTPALYKGPRTVIFRRLSSAHSLIRVQLFVTPWTAARQASLSTTSSQSLLKLTSKSVMPCSHLSSPSPTAFSLSQHQSLFQGDSSSHHVDKILEFQCQHQSFQWIFRTDFL